MAQMHKIEVETQVKCSADKFYGALRNNLTDLVKICPEVYKSIKILEGDVRSEGCIVDMEYSVASPKPVFLKLKIPVIDDESRTIVYETMEGDLKNHYDSFTFKFQVSENGEGALAKWSMEFEKANEDVPTPNAYLDLFTTLNKTLDAYLIANA